MANVSIVLLTLNAGPEFQTTLEAICSQDTSRSLEIVAVDSGSTDGTLDLLRRFGARIHCIPREQFNFGATRALGYDLARGEFIVTLSQDCVPVDRTWLETLLAPFADPNIAAVQGCQLLPPPPTRILYWERINRFYFTRESTRWIARYHFGGSNTDFAMRRAVWEQNRLGAMEMSEDKLLQKTWTARGLKIVFEAQALVYHGHDYDLVELAHRCRNEGLGCRLIAERYSFVDMVCDILNAPNWAAWARGLASGQIRTSAELLFPIVRPFFMWKGNHFAEKYAR